MTIDTKNTIHVAVSDTDIHLLLPLELNDLDVQVLKLNDRDPESNDRAIYRLAAEEMDEASLYNIL